MQAPSNLNALYHVIGCGSLAAFTSLLGMVVLERLNGVENRIEAAYPSILAAAAIICATVAFPLTIASAAMIIASAAFDHTTRVTLEGAYVFASMIGPITIVLGRTLRMAWQAA